MAISTEKLLTLQQFQTGLQASKNYTDKTVEAEKTRAMAAEQANATAASNAQTAAEAAQGTADQAKSAAATAQAGVDTNKSDITTMKGQIAALEAGTYDDTEVRGKITALEEADEAHDGKISTLETFKSTTEAKDTEQDGKISALETFKSTTEAKDTEQDGKISALETADGEQDEKIAALEEQITGLTGAMHFRGKLDAIPEDVSGYAAGDVIIVGDKEYVFNDGAFVELGDVSAEGERLTALEEAVEDLHNYDDTALVNRVSALETADGQQDTKIAELEAKDTELASDISDLDTNKADKSTTLAGYGITDAYKKSEVDAAIADFITEADVQINVASDAEVTEVCTAVFGA